MPRFEPRIIRNIKINWKFRLAALGFLLPVGILLYLLVSEKDIAIDFAEKELKGTSYLQPLNEIYRYMWQLDRGAIYGGLSGDEARVLGEKIDKAFNRLNEFERNNPSYKKVSGQVKEIISLRTDFINSFPLLTLEEKGLRSMEMLQEVRSLIINVGDKSNLILDPRLDSYYMMNALLTKIPEVTFQTYQLIQYSDMINKGMKLDADETARVIVLNGLLKSSIAKTRLTIESAFGDNADGQLKSALNSVLQEAVSKSDIFTQIVDRALRTRKMPEKSLFEKSANETVDASYKLWKASSAELDNLLRERIAELNSKKYTALIVVGSLLLFTTLLFVFISGYITGSVGQLNQAANRVSIGDLNASVNINANDELGNLGLNFNKMVAELRSFIKEKTELFEETEKELTNRIQLHLQQEEATSQQLRNLSSRLQSIREEERTMIAREIHDELGQVLTVLKIQISLLSNKLRDDQKYLKEKIESANKVIDKTVESVQRISAKLRPGILDDLGLIPAIEWQAQDFQNSTGIRCDLSLPKEEIEMDEEKSTAIFRIFQEALTNVARHADASLITVYLGTVYGNLVLEITDNGKGITEDQIYDSKSLGLLGMKERAYILGGSVKISGEPGRGTSVKVLMPVITKVNSENSEAAGSKTLS